MIREALERLGRQKRGTGALEPAQPRGALPAGVGIAYPGASSEQATGAALGSPLVEVDRTYYGAKVITSSDGLFTLEVLPVKTIDFEDPSTNTIQFVLSDPP